MRIEAMTGYEIELVAAEGARRWAAWDGANGTPEQLAWRQWRNENPLLASAVKATWTVAIDDRIAKANAL